jgi:hypothetical protein
MDVLQLSAAARGTGETKKAAQTAFGKQALTMQLFHLGGMVSDRCRPHQVQRFEAAIAQRSSPGPLPTVLLHLDQVQTDASVRAWHCFVRYGWPKTGGVYGVCCDVSALRGAVFKLSPARCRRNLPLPRPMPGFGKRRGILRLVGIILAHGPCSAYVVQKSTRWAIVDHV